MQFLNHILSLVYFLHGNSSCAQGQCRNWDLAPEYSIDLTYFGPRTLNTFGAIATGSLPIDCGQDLPIFYHSSGLKVTRSSQGHIFIRWLLLCGAVLLRSRRGVLLLLLLCSCNSFESGTYLRSFTLSLKLFSPNHMHSNI